MKKRPTVDDIKTLTIDTGSTISMLYMIQLIGIIIMGVIILILLLFWGG